VAEPTARGTDISPGESRRLSTGLIVYGAVGLALAIAAAVAVVLMSGRFDDVTTDVTARVDALETTLDKTAQSLDDTADSAEGFSGTLSRTGEGLVEAAALVERLGPLLVDVGNVNVLGFRPLAELAPLFEDVGDRLVGLAPRLDEIAGELVVNEAQLSGTSESVRALAVQVHAIEAQLATGFLEDRVDQGFDFLRIGIIALTIWFAVPAAAALFIGIWLRRAVAPAAA
jgi:hypothetical protein